MSFFQEVERIIKSRNSGALEVLMFYNAIPLKIFEQVKDKASAVYGTSSGKISNTYTEIRGILVSDDFFESDSSSSGDFKQGFLYTQYKVRSLVGCYVQVGNVDDDNVRMYKVNNLKTIGTTTEVLHRYEVLSVAV